MHIWKSLLRRAYEEATKSPDPSTQNGAIVGYRREDAFVVLGSGCNRLPDGVAPTHERLHTPLKYLCVVHAECNAIFDVLKGRDYRVGLTMVAPWAACTNCAKTIIMLGIKTLVRHKQAHQQSAGNLKWKEEIEVADVLMREAGIDIIEYDGEVGAPPILHSGKYWNP